MRSRLSFCSALDTALHTTLGLTGLCVSALLLSACGETATRTGDREMMVEQETLALDDWFAARWEDRLARSPMLRTELGLGDDHSQLDDISRMGLDENAALTESWLRELRTEYDVARLSDDAALSHELFTFGAGDDLAAHGIGDRTYAFTHMSGPHTGLPSFLINSHKVENAGDAQDYISRLQAVDDYLGGARERAEAQANRGVLLPRFVYEKLTASARNIITGAPFSEGPDSPLLADVKAKVEALDIASAEKSELIEQARKALISDVQPAYLALIRTFTNHAQLATEDDGVWKIDEDGDYYAARLRHYTTTDMSADDVHEIGLREVAAIQEQMLRIKDEVGFEGTLVEFFDHLRTDAQFTYPDDDTGRQAYITKATAYIDDMKARMDELFITQPVAEVVVKRVEPFRQASAFGAFYERPATDGSRPGTYYINLKDMAELPIYQMQALAYHEGIPGHHMQIAIAQELSGIPEFRKLAIHVPYVEGWALYAEEVPKELGLYTDPYQEFGQLSMALFRAVRLVVDTGIHTKKWTREEANTYMMENTANSEGDIAAEVDRYIVWPGQATAYMIGKLKIVELRERAETRLGDDFDVREFHDVVLAGGSVPLSILERRVDDWINDMLGTEEG